MTSITEFLPTPRQMDEVDEEEQDGGEESTVRVVSKVPVYPLRNRSRPRFIPRTQEDYEDGGAYPEIRITQFPLEMGRKGRQTAVSKTVAMRVDEEGDADYAAVVKQGEKSSAVVHASYKDVMEKARDESKLQRPSEEEENATADRTRDALEKLVSGKIAAAQPRNFRGSGSAPKPTYIKYQPIGAESRHNSGSSQRIIRMMEAPVDPLEPPKFHQKKVPPQPPSPPAPIMHSPPRKLTAEDAKNWKIPPCISNWKNNKGYTIPLDKRLAADGRGLQDLRINDNFAKLAESLYTAERTARDMVEQRAKMQRHITLKEKDKKEQELRDLAARARAERSGIVRPGAAVASGGNPTSSVTSRREKDLSPEESPSRNRSPTPPRRSAREEVDSPVRRSASRDEDSDEERERKKRDDLRRERQREREREFRQRERAGEAGATAKRSKLSRDRDRDISERLALGQKVKSGNGNSEVMYDQRLFNQGKSGMDSGFAAEDTYNLYDKPLFAGKGDGFMYRPSAEGEEAINTSRFKADKDFAGLKETNASRGGTRSKPVEFEKDASTSIKEQNGKSEDDPFGFGKFLSDAKKGRTDKMDSALEKRRKGSMGL